MKLFVRSSHEVPSLEELEIEKVVRQDEQNDSSLVFDDVYSETKDRIEQLDKSEESEAESAEDTAQPPASDASEPGERVVGDSETPDTDNQDSSDDHDAEDESETNEDSTHDESPDGDDELEELTKDDEDETPPNISTESLRYLLAIESYNVRHYHGPAFESYGYDEIPFEQKSTREYTKNDWRLWGRQKVNSTTDATGSLAKSSLRWLKDLGIKLTTDTIPNIAKHTFKGLVYAFDRLGYSFMAGLVSLDQYIHRRVNSLNSLHANIEKASKALELLDNGRADELDDTDVYDVQSVINQIVIGGDTDLVKNISITNKFITDSIQGLGVSIKEDLASIRELIAYSSMHSSYDVLSLLEVKLKVPGLREGAVAGFAAKSELINTYYTGTLLPGSTCLIAQIPNNTHKEREQWIEAYRDSDIFLGVDRSRFKLVDKIAFKNVAELKKLTSALNALCTTCIHHQAFYEAMKKQKLEQRLVYKNYFDGLIKRPEKVSVKNSLIDLVTLKNNFVDKVYLPAAIDVHDFAVRVINANLRYIEKNIKVLTP